MNTAPNIIPPALRHLWQSATLFITTILNQFDRTGIRAGIRRASGVRLSILLADAESALRRLILTAALALTPAPLKQRLQTSQPKPHTKHPTFTVFRLHGSGQPTHRRAHYTQREAQTHAHIRFPADPLLALNRTPTNRPTHRHNGGPVLPRPTKRNPLDRWGRLSRNDPDWRPPEPHSSPLMLDYRVLRAPTPRASTTHTKHDSTADWRRCYDEWEKLTPAPHLAARLDALERIAANPASLIHRTARRLQSHRARTLALARTARPATHLPHRARHVRTTGLDTGHATTAHDNFVDSS